MRKKQWKRRGWKNLKAGRVLEKPKPRINVLDFGCSFEIDMHLAYGRMCDALAKSAVAFDRAIEKAFGILGEKGRAAFDDIYSTSFAGRRRGQ